MLTNSSFSFNSVYYFNDENYIKFTKLVNRVNKKIIKENSNAATISFECSKEVLPFKEVYGHNPFNSKCSAFVEVNAVRFSDDFTRYFTGENTRILGVIDHKENIVYGDADILEMYRYSTHCDHCQKNIHRNKTLVIETEKNGKNVVMQVGGTCVKDYTGIDLSVIASVLSIQNGGGLNEREFNGGKTSAFFELREVAARTIVSIDKCGFASKKNGGENATVFHVLDSFELAGKDVDRLEATEEQYRKADEILEELRGIEVNSPFDGNVKAIVENESGLIGRKHIPYITAAIGLKYNASVKEENGSNEWIGTIGEAVSLSVEVKNIKHVKGMYGVQTLYEMSDCSGNKVVWFTSREKYSIGDSLNIVNGTVKKHSEYKGIKSTVVGGRGMKVSVK